MFCDLFSSAILLVQQSKARNLSSGSYNAIAGSTMTGLFQNISVHLQTSGMCNCLDVTTHAAPHMLLRWMLLPLHARTGSVAELIEPGSDTSFFSTRDVKRSLEVC